MMEAVMLSEIRNVYNKCSTFLFVGNYTYVSIQPVHCFLCYIKSQSCPFASFRSSEKHTIDLLQIFFFYPNSVIFNLKTGLLRGYLRRYLEYPGFLCGITVFYRVRNYIGKNNSETSFVSYQGYIL